MSMLRALAMMGAGSSGYIHGEQEQQEQQRRQNEEAFLQQQRAYQTSQMQRVLQQQADMSAAGAPVQAAPDMANTPDGPMQRMVKPEDQDNRDVGQPGEQAPMPALAVGKQAGLNPMQAQAAVAAQNTPEAVQARQIAALGRTDPAAALKLQAEALKTQGDQITVQAQKFDQQVNKGVGGSWDSFTENLNKINPDHAPSRFIPDPDGKMGTIEERQADGSWKPTPARYANSVQGQQEAAAALSQHTPPMEKVKHIMAQEQLSRQEKRDADLHEVSMLHAKAQQAYWEGLNQNRADAIEQKGDAAAGKTAKIPEEDKALLTDLNKQLELINSERVKAQASGMWQPDSPGAMSIKKQEAGLMMQRDSLLAKYRDRAGPSGPVDPLGIRKPSSAPAQTPQSPMARVLMDMRQSATTDADINLGGKTVKYRDGLQVDAPAPSMAAAPEPASVQSSPPAAPGAKPAQAASPAMAAMSTLQLTGLTQSPRASPQLRAAAAAELQRRGRIFPDRTAEPQTDPALYAAN